MASASVSFRLRPSEEDRLKQAASRLNLPMVAWCRNMLAQAAARISREPEWLPSLVNAVAARNISDTARASPRTDPALRRSLVAHVSTTQGVVAEIETVSKAMGRDRGMVLRAILAAAARDEWPFDGTLAEVAMEQRAARLIRNIMLPAPLLGAIPYPLRRMACSLVETETVAMLGLVHFQRQPEARARIDRAFEIIGPRFLGWGEDGDPSRIEPAVMAPVEARQATWDMVETANKELGFADQGFPDDKLATVIGSVAVLDFLKRIKP